MIRTKTQVYLDKIHKNFRSLKIRHSLELNFVNNEIKEILEN